MSEPSGTDARLDRIEELMKEKTALNHLFNTTYNRHVAEIIAVEAKLTKAVEALRWYADFGNYLSNRGDYAPIDLDKGGKAEDTLAELEGEEEATGTAWRGRE
jgi:hypothetical protein